jgi:tRNA nucleotidyltransferase/poly(A) polymerase
VGVFFCPNQFFNKNPNKLKNWYIMKLKLNISFKIIFWRWKNMTIYENINRLVSYGLKTKLFPNEDRIFIQNKLLELFNLDGFDTYEEAQNLPNVEVADLENILKEMLDYAVSQKFIDDNIVEKDLFDTKIMSQLVPPPSVVREKFASLKAKTPKEILPHHYNNEENGIKHVRDLCNRLKVPNSWKKLAIATVKEHMRAGIFEKMSIPKKVEFLERNFKCLYELEIISKADSKNLELSFFELGRKMINEVNGNTINLPNNKNAKDILHEKRVQWLKNCH